MINKMYTCKLLSLFLFCVFLKQANGSEPLCSKYENDEKLLERMVQVQFNVRMFAMTLESIKKKSMIL